MVKAVICVDPLLKFGCTKGQEMVFPSPSLRKELTERKRLKIQKRKVIIILKDP